MISKIVEKVFFSAVKTVAAGVDRSFFLHIISVYLQCKLCSCSLIIQSLNHQICLTVFHSLIMKRNGGIFFLYLILAARYCDIPLCGDLIFRCHIGKTQFGLWKICFRVSCSLYPGSLQHSLLFFHYFQTVPAVLRYHTAIGISKWQCLISAIHRIFFILCYLFCISIRQVLFFFFLNNKISYTSQAIQYRASIQSVIHLFHGIGCIHLLQEFCYRIVRHTVIKIGSIQSILHSRIFSGYIAILVISVKGICVSNFLNDLILRLCRQHGIRCALFPEISNIIGLIR